ncbi:MAG: hypothetical protein JJU29_03045 [Verrucomicrobia bacterium]|nr:hypothetical protein [Verrucomicrobiota bacterium]MCH8511150.1 hypothetical protein [Kiritimatiellia bacterium]
MKFPTLNTEVVDIRSLLKKAYDRVPSGHFCHYTSVVYHGLTNQVPNRVYIRKRDVGSNRSRPDRLSDLQIRTQFLKPHRRSGDTENLGGGTIVFIAGRLHDEIGVVSVPSDDSGFPQGSRITNLERCLIDAVVAPHYNGGITTLPGLFEEAVEQLDILKLIEHYRELDFLYPYHQTLGFFLDHSGQEESAARWREHFPPTNRFFVDKDAKSSWPYDPKWQVHYPRGLVNAD